EATGDAGESLEEMVKRAASRHYPFPYLVDADQEIARAYGARVTPHVFLLDAGGRLVYRGRIDDAARPEQVTTEDLKKALHALLDGKPTPSPATRAFGCTIRWNPEIAP
ncbi:MAG: redoxin family protein, partial [Acidobacteriota bacterium]